MSVASVDQIMSCLPLSLCDFVDLTLEYHLEKIQTPVGFDQELKEKELVIFVIR